MGLLGSLFGGSKSKSSSSNQAFGYLKDALAGTVSGGTNAFSQLSDLLGGGFDQYKNDAGFNYALNTGTRNIAGGAAAKGLLNSGSTSKALANYESNLGNQYYNNYLDKLQSLVTGGLQGAGIIAGAGQTSTSSGKSNGGILSSLFG